MKKIFVLLLTCFSVLSATAQVESDNTPKFHFGVKLAPGICWLRSEKNADNTAPESQGSLLRASYGFVADIKFSKNYFFSTGVNVNYQGGRLKLTKSYPADTSTVQYNQELRVAYIETPLTLRMQTNEIGYIKYYFQAGLAPGFNFRSSYDGDSTKTYSDNSSSVGNESEVDVIDDINFLNLSMLVGAGISYNLSGTTDLLVGISFHNGFLDVSEKKAKNTVLMNSKLNSNMLSLDIAVLF